MEPLTSHLVLAADAAIDLQMHTTYSDGTWTPEQLIDYLVSEHFGLVAVTDHDRVDSVASIQYLAAQKQLPVLAAAEMSTSWHVPGVCPEAPLTDQFRFGLTSPRI